MRTEPIYNSELLPAIVPTSQLPHLPPVLAGNLTPEIRERVGEFYHSVAAIFQAWFAKA